MGTGTATIPTKEQYTDFARAASELLCAIPDWRDAEPEARRDKIIELATDGNGHELSDIIYLADALAKVRAFVNIELSQRKPAPEQPAQQTVASDWLASVTPNRNGDFVSPGGMRFNFTLHDGATASMALALILEADRAFRQFAEYGIRLYEAPAAQPVTPPAQHQGAPSTASQAPASDGAGYEVFGVGRCQPGKTYEVQITRVKPGATLNNSPTLDMYRPGDKFRFLTVFERQFGEFEERTGINPTTMNPREEVTVNLKVFFRLATDAEGKVKTTDKGNPRIDFAGIA